MLSIVNVVEKHISQYNKCILHYVLTNVMKTIEKGKKIIESKPYSSKAFGFYGVQKGDQSFQNQQFVVPWQMIQKKENEILVK